MLREYPRMVVLRSLTKFYAMPGLRIGYLLGASKVVDHVKDRQPPWSVNSLAQEVSCAVLQDDVYAMKSRAFMRNERFGSMRGLRSLSGLRVYSSAANFVLIELPASIGAGEVTDRLVSRETARPRLFDFAGPDHPDDSCCGRDCGLEGYLQPLAPACGRPSHEGASYVLDADCL